MRLTDTDAEPTDADLGALMRAAMRAAEADNRKAQTEFRARFRDAMDRARRDLDGPDRPDL